ncbi:MAG: Kelch repeat-containing protein [Planctomycetota bacterium]
MKNTITFVLVGLMAAIVLASAGSARADTWTQKADMPTPRWAHAAGVVNGKIYVIGGLTSETSFLNGKALAVVEEYDPVTDTWTRKADMPAARGYLGGSLPVVDGKIYLIGGGKSAVAHVDIYDPVMDTWSRGADMPTPRNNVATVAWNDKIYAFGGLTGTLGSSAPTVNVTQVYDPRTDTWAEAAPMPRGVWGHSANVVDDKIYVVGGASATNALRIVQVYDPQTDMWTNATPIPKATRHFGASVLCGKIYVVGGWLKSSRTPYSDTWVYDPTMDTWTASVPIPERKVGPTSMVNGRIYAIGGSSTPHNIQATATVYELEVELGFAQPDFNGDGVVDGADISIMADHWHTDEPSCDIAPAPCGDGIVDVQDLVLLSEYLLKEESLIAHWALDETEGDIAQDSAGDNFGYVIGGPVWQPTGGQVDGALQLDGVDDVVIAGPTLNPAGGPFSVLAWIRGGAAGQTVISEPGGANWLSIDPLDGFLMTELTEPGRSSSPLLSGTTITDGQWHRIGFVWDGYNRTLYVDGVAVAQDAQDSLESSSNGLYIGTGNAMATGTYFSGLIDDVRIYNRAVKCTAARSDNFS